MYERTRGASAAAYCRISGGQFRQATAIEREHLHCQWFFDGDDATFAVHPRLGGSGGAFGVSCLQPVVRRIGTGRTARYYCEEHYEMIRANAQGKDAQKAIKARIRAAQRWQRIVADPAMRALVLERRRELRQRRREEARLRVRENVLTGA